MSIVKGKKELIRIFDQATKNFTYQESLIKIEKILSEQPELKDDRALSKLGFLYDHLALCQKNHQLKLKYEKQALNFYDQALKFNPESFGAIWGIGRVWWHRKNKKALRYARQAAVLATRKDPKMFSMFINVAVVHETLGNFRRAEYWYRRVLDNDPNSWSACYGLVNLYYSHPTSIQRIKKLKKLLPKLLMLYKKEFKKNRGSQWGKDSQKKVLGIIAFINKK